MRTHETAELSKIPLVRADDKEKVGLQKNQMQQSISVVSLSVQQLQDMITSSIRAQYGGPQQTSFMYSKPCTKRINDLRMPVGYQPLKSNNSTERAIQSNTLVTLLKHAKTQDQEETN
ncbi:ty3-gypsy retrotransposon protein [Cucumis melo var. makuwa]|uniref:Ty3-gypsy retrotransposon protein n=1 Tax=Cucumis melo var. makuwa TaxID=1194695 RepID=A0A5D3E2N2_CUCMM|nr:ty3-gypsy retrotransposon protein [Cucumis melo var. makuwa]